MEGERECTGVFVREGEADGAAETLIRTACAIDPRRLRIMLPPPPPPPPPPLPLPPPPPIAPDRPRVIIIICPDLPSAAAAAAADDDDKDDVVDSGILGPEPVMSSPMTRRPSASALSKTGSSSAIECFLRVEATGASRILEELRRSGKGDADEDEDEEEEEEEDEEEEEKEAADGRFAVTVAAGSVSLTVAAPLLVLVDVGSDGRGE